MKIIVFAWRIPQIARTHSGTQQRHNTKTTIQAKPRSRWEFHWPWTSREYRILLVLLANPSTKPFSQHSLSHRKATVLVCFFCFVSLSSSRYKSEHHALYIYQHPHTSFSLSSLKLPHIMYVLFLQTFVTLGFFWFSIILPTSSPPQYNIATIPKHVIVVAYLPVIRLKCAAYNISLST